MKFSAFVTISFATLGVAAPAEDVHQLAARTNDKRQACQYGFVFARGSAELPPIGSIVGPKLQAALRTRLPGMRTFPVLYSASIATNISPARTDPSSISKGVSTFNQAQGCRVIVAGGYSQGAAVMHNSVSKLNAALKNKIAGVALFGDTRNKQDAGHIRNFPKDRSRVWCKTGDGVCKGTLAVGASHLAYSQVEAQSAATWLAQKAKSHR